MARYQRRTQKEPVTQVPGDSMVIYGEGLIFGGNAYPVLADGMPMQKTSTVKQQELPIQQRHKSLPATSQKATTRTTDRRQKRMQQMAQPLADAQIPERQRCRTQHSQPQKQSLLQQQQQQLQQQQLQQLYGCWPFRGMPQTNTNCHNLAMFNGHAANGSAYAQVYNYGSVPFSVPNSYWPGYTMLQPTDPSKPFAFGFGATD